MTNTKTLGNIDVIKSSRRNNYCEVAYSVNQRYWGKGYATEMLKAVINYLFTIKGYHIIQASHYESNIVSGKVMEKAGMVKEAILYQRRYNSLQDKYEDLICYRICNQDWEKA